MVRGTYIDTCTDLTLYLALHEKAVPVESDLHKGAHKRARAISNKQRKVGSLNSRELLLTVQLRHSSSRLALRCYLSITLHGGPVNYGNQLTEVDLR